MRRPSESATCPLTRTRPNVTLRGPIPSSEVTALLREHDVLILLSEYEGLPLSLLEAMGEGLVPVVTDLSGISAVVTPECGLPVANGEVALAENALLRLGADRSLLAALSAGARTRARTSYSARTMVSRYLDLIRSLAGNGPRPVWPGTVPIPRPFVAHRPWLYSGLPRQIRRQLKALLPTPPGSAPRGKPRPPR